jgi:hypothetical protein
MPTVLKWPKLEILGSLVFTQIRPVRVDDSGATVGKKILKVYGWGLIFTFISGYFLALSATISSQNHKLLNFLA